MAPRQHDVTALMRRCIRTVVGPASYDEVGIAYSFLRRRPSPGWVVDVGAHIGDSSRPFAERGWKILALEPDPVNRSRLERLAAEHPFFHVDPRAVALKDGEELTLYRSDLSPGISTLSAFDPSHEVGPTVSTVRLDTLFAERGIEEVAFLKTDIEGYDFFALQTFPWADMHPAVVVSEFENRKTRRLGYTVDTMAEYLQEQRYTVFISEWRPIIEYGAVHSWKSIHRYPSTEIDEAGWGNLIAVDPEHASLLHRLARLRAHQLHLRIGLTRLRALFSR